MRERSVDAILQCRVLITPEFHRTNEIVAEPWVVLRIENVDGPVDHAAHAGQLAGIPVVTKPYIKMPDRTEIKRNDLRPDGKIALGR